MPHFNIEELSPTQIYKFLSGSIIPRPVAWITTQNDSKVVNAAPFSFFNGAGGPFVSVSIGRTDYGLKDTAKNLIQTKEAVIHLTDMKNARQMNETSASLPADVSEIEEFGLELVASQTVAVPGLNNARVRFEALLHSHTVLEHPGGINDFFLLRITDIYFDEDIFDDIKEYVLFEQLQPIARLSGNFYASLGKVFEMKRPD